MVAAAGTALTAGSGCLFGSAHRGRADSVSGKVTNDATEQRTVTARLVTSGGGADLEETYELGDYETAEFEVQEPDDDYTLAVEANDGVAGETDWDVTPCSNHVSVAVGGEGVEFRFTQC
ncbi:hypothetical protein SAMN04487945_2146 [Halobacterium jilantaiense]|uniref:Ig-like domain-containing protein n=1 Tax=Halobacterium jilantaiense TaxID=355548 RepID=A0A1I0Q0D4_9EURY|nr:hypothetical protein SAMN04487945_2146 [Halobacterium jilantaiense]